MANEIVVTVKGQVEPDLTKLVKRTQSKYPDWFTGKTIPSKSTAYALAERYGNKIYKRYVTVDSYETHIAPYLEANE